MNLDESFNRAVIGLLHIIGKEAGRELAGLPVISQTLTADAFPDTGFVGAITLSLVLPYRTFSHSHSPLLII
jgi:hypothetical protein